MSSTLENFTLDSLIVPPLELSQITLDEASMRKYSAIKTLTLHWEGEILDNLPYGPAKEARMLTRTFANWRWKADDYAIPLKDPVRSTEDFLRRMTEKSKRDELLVVYYVGHGGNSQPFMVARQGSKASEEVLLEWSAIHSVLEAADCDVVIFLNCCHGANASVTRDLEGKGFAGPAGKAMCILAATNKGQEAFMNQSMSFGTLLKKALDSTRGDPGSHISISITQLVEKMRNEIGRSEHFRVRDVVGGGFLPMELYSEANDDIVLHSLSSLLKGQLYQHLSCTGKYWQRLR